MRSSHFIRFETSPKEAYVGEKASFPIYTKLFLLHNGSMISPFPWCQIVSGLQLLYKELSESLYLMASYQAVVLVHLQLIWVKTPTFLMFVWVCSMGSQGATSTSILTASPRNVQSPISGINWWWPSWGHDKSNKYKCWGIWILDVFNTFFVVHDLNGSLALIQNFFNRNPIAITNWIIQ